MPAKKSILIVGVGSIGERHLRCFQATGRADVSLCEVNAALGKTVADRLNVTRVFTDLETATAQKPDGAVICTPAHVHIPIATTLAKKGIHLLIEKPLSTTLDGLEALQAEVTKNKLVTAVGYVFRTNSALTSMREALHSGRFGEPVQLIAPVGQNFPFYRPGYEKTYYNNHATGGGAVQDALTHCVNFAEWLIGPVNQLTADAAHQVIEGVEVEDTVNVLTRHGRVLGAFALNQHQAPNENIMTIVCTKGTVRFEAHNNRWRWQIETNDTWHDEPSEKGERDTPFIRQAESFLDAIEGVRPPLCTLEEGIQTLRVNLAILRSIKDRQWQKI